jgi:hypothetical protein
MTMPGMLDINQRRRTGRGRFITRMFAVGTAAALAGGGVVAITQNVPQADAATQVQINRFIRSEGGIPPCAVEDGSDQPHTTCVWWAGRQGNGDGYSVLLVPDGRDADDDKDVIFITGPLAVRRQ